MQVGELVRSNIRARPFVHKVNPCNWRHSVKLLCIVPLLRAASVCLIDDEMARVRLPLLACNFLSARRVAQCNNKHRVFALSSHSAAISSTNGPKVNVEARDKIQ